MNAAGAGTAMGGASGTAASAGGSSGTVAAAGGSSGSAATGGSSGAGVGGRGGREPGEAGEGGASAGGAAGASPGCATLTERADTTSCFLDFVCDARHDVVECLEQPSGRWKCNCGVVHPDRVYEVAGATGADVCRLVQGFCADDELELEPETCVEGPGPEAGGCSVALSCGSAITASYPPGVAAWLTSYMLGACQRPEEGLPFTCSCTSFTIQGDIIRDYDVVAADGADACGPIVDFCRSGEEPVFDGDASCVDEYMTVGTDGCWLDQACVTPMPLADDVSLALVTPRRAGCSPLPQQRSGCVCAGPGSDAPGDEIFRFELEAPPDAVACSFSASACDEDAVIQPLGPVSCEPDVFSSDTNYCGRSFLCRQPASIDGREVTALAQLLTHCERAAPGSPWVCSCSTGGATTTIELGLPELEPPASCQAAPAPCFEQMPFPLGLAPEPTPPVDPLP